MVQFSPRIVPQRSLGGVCDLRRKTAPHNQIQWHRPVARSAADRFSSIVRCARHQAIAMEAEPADHLFKVVTGTMRATRLLPDGRRQIMSFMVPGDMFGFTNNGRYLHSAEAVEDTTLFRYSWRRLHDLMRTDPHVAYCLYIDVREALVAAEERLLLLGRKVAMERLATFLLSMADRAGRTNSDGFPEVLLCMNRSDIADHLGLSVETVSRMFTRLCRRRIISLPEAERVVVVRRDALEHIGNCL